MENYGRELRIEVDIRRRKKVKKTTELIERMKRIQEKAKIALRKVQEEMTRQVDKGRREAEVWRKCDRVMLSTKDLVFKE